MNYPKASESTKAFFAGRSELNINVPLLPPSKSNSYVPYIRNGRAMIGKSKKIKRFEKQFGLFANRYKGILLNGMLDIEIDCHLTNVKQDVDNCAKAILDCLEEYKIIKNDYMVYKLLLNKIHAENGGNIDIKIKQFEILE